MRMALSVLFVKGMTGGQDGDVFFRMALRRAHITNPAVGMVMVVPVHEGVAIAHPGS